MEKKILALVITLIICFLGVWVFYSNHILEQESSERFTINTHPDFLIASNLLTEKKFQDAENIFSSLENLSNLSMNDLAFLRLKKLQISLLEGEYTKSADLLEGIVTNPMFPKETKGRAVENILTTYLKNGRDPLLYDSVFTRETFSSLKRDSPLESVYAFADYGYQLQPTTILGANVLYSKIDHLQKMSDKSSPDYKNELNEVAKFSVNFFSKSDDEIERLTKQKFQEIALINIFSERSRVIKKLSRIGLEAPESLSMEGQLSAALKQADLLGDGFYLFYTAFNYLDYLSANKKPADPAMLEIIKKQGVFSKGSVKKEWILIVTSLPVGDNLKERLFAYDPGLVEVLQSFSK